MHRSWEFIGGGWDRIAYRIGELVIKIPKHIYGEQCNVFEAKNWSQTDGQCVRTRILRLPSLASYLGFVDGARCAVQPYLRPPTDGYERPSWSMWYDGAQGGINRMGEFQIYDFPPNYMSLAATFM